MLLVLFAVIPFLERTTHIPHKHCTYIENGREVFAPGSFADAFPHVVFRGCPSSFALKETLDKFYTPPRDIQLVMIDKTISTDYVAADPEYAAYIASIVEQLAIDYKFHDEKEMESHWTSDTAFILKSPYTTFDISVMSEEAQVRYMDQCLPLAKSRNVYITTDSFSYKGFYPARDWTKKKFEKYNNVIPE